MIINKKPKRSFIHLHKCCGKTISNILIEQFGYEEVRSQPFQAHDGVNENKYLDSYRNFISIREPVEILCSKFSMRIKNNNKFKESDFDTFLENYFNNNIDTISSPKEHNPIRQARYFLYRAFPTGLITHQMLFQTCDVSNIYKYSNVEDFFINENKIDHIVRKENLKNDLISFLGKEFEIKHKNSSNLTKKFLRSLTKEQKQQILSKEQLFFKLYKGEFDDYIRGH